MDHVNLYRAGMVKRWHQNPELSSFDQNIASHQWGVAMLIFMFAPKPSISLIQAALTHDVGELRCGDLSGPFKENFPEFSNRHAEIERVFRLQMLGNSEPVLTPEEQDWLHFCDKFEAVLFTKFHRPEMLGKNGWPESVERCLQMANALECRDNASQLLMSL